MYICIYSHKMPQKLTTTVCFIQEEYLGGRPEETGCIYW